MSTEKKVSSKKSLGTKTTTKVIVNEGAAKLPDMVLLPATTKIYVRVDGRLRGFVTNREVVGKFVTSSPRPAESSDVADQVVGYKASSKSTYKLDQPGTTKKVKR